MMPLKINGNQLWNTVLFDALWTIDMMTSEQRNTQCMHLTASSTTSSTTSSDGGLSPLLSSPTTAANPNRPQGVSLLPIPPSPLARPIHFLSEWNQRRVDQGLLPYNAIRLLSSKSNSNDKQVEVHLLSPPYDTCPPACINQSCWLMVAIRDEGNGGNDDAAGSRKAASRSKRNNSKHGGSWRLSDMHDAIPLVWTHRNADIDALQSTFRNENAVLPQDLEEGYDSSLDTLAPGDWHLTPKRRWIQQRMKRAIGVHDEATSVDHVAGLNLYMPSYMPSPTLVHASRWLYGHEQTLRDYGHQLLYSLQFVLSCIYCRAHYTPLSKMWIGNPATMREVLRGTQLDVPSTGEIHDFSFFLWLTKHLVNMRRERGNDSLSWHLFQMQRATYSGVLGAADHVWPLMAQLAMGVWDMGTAENEQMPARDATTGEMPAQQGRLPPRSDPRIFFSSEFDTRASAFCFADHFDGNVAASRDWLTDVALGDYSNRTRLSDWYRRFAAQYPSLVSRGVLIAVNDSNSHASSSSSETPAASDYELWRAPDEKMISQGAIGNMASVRTESSNAYISPEDRASRTKADDEYKAYLRAELEKLKDRQRELQSGPFNPKDNKILQNKMELLAKQLTKIETLQQSEVLQALAVRLERHYHANDIYGWPTDETFGAKRRALANMLESLSVLYRYNGSAAYASLCDYLYPLPEWAANGPVMTLTTWLIIQSWRWWCATQWWPVAGSNNVTRASSLVLTHLTQQFMPWIHMGGYRAADILRAKRNAMNLAEGIRDSSGDDYLQWTGAEDNGKSPFALRDVSAMNDVFMNQLQTLKGDMQSLLARGCVASSTRVSTQQCGHTTSTRRWFTGEVHEWCDAERAWMVQYVEFVWRIYPSFTGGAQMDAVFGFPPA